MTRVTKQASRYLCLSIMFIVALSLFATDKGEDQWKLVWSEEFETPQIDESTWSKIPRGKADWDRHMSAADSLYNISEGILTLRGVNNSNQADTARFLTGGIWTKGKRSFTPGRIEVKARFNNARGAWPAIWLMPFDTIAYAWPKGGEIDMMEHLNYDSIVY